ncbi:MAG: hypothetical protein HC815_04060 [Richelia sp. RM1_1_1]|nr:hypothetical protein [Richelia sp. RM1_1_1]
MTNFNPKNQHKSNDEWAELALRQSGNTNTQYHVIGGLFGAVFLAGATSPLTGLILGAWVIWSAWCKSGESARNKEHIISSRCIANTLEGDDFHFYRDQYGDDAIAEQLQFAEKLNLGLSNDALDFLEDYETLHPNPALLSSDSSKAALEQKLDTLTTPASDSKPSTKSDIQWIDSVLKLPFRIITGEQGSGKSTLERFMISELKKAGYHIIIINPETNPNVWKGVEVIADPDKITEFFEDFPTDVRNRQIEARDNGIDEDDYFDFIERNNRTGRKGKVAIFFQESNTYEVQGVNAQAIADTFKQCLTNIRKWGYTACLTAHSGNQTSISSKLRGYSGLIEQQPLIECISSHDPNTGLAVSSGKGFLKIKGVKDSNPKSVKLINYPKTKDFRTEQEKHQEIIPTSTEQPTKLQDKAVSDNSIADSLETLYSIETEQENQGVSTEALQVLSRIERLEGEDFTAGKVAQLKPFGKNGDNSASKIKYYLDELVIANLLEKVEEKYRLLER